MTRWLKPLAREIFGLFVDDGIFALTILLWIAAVGFLLPLLPLPPGLRGAVVFAGFAVTLAGSCVRQAVRRGRST